MSNMEYSISEEVSELMNKGFDEIKAEVDIMNDETTEKFAKMIVDSIPSTISQEAFVKMVNENQPLMGLKYLIGIMKETKNETFKNLVQQFQFSESEEEEENDKNSVTNETLVKAEELIRSEEGSKFIKKFGDTMVNAAGREKAKKLLYSLFDEYNTEVLDFVYQRMLITGNKKGALLESSGSTEISPKSAFEKPKKEVKKQETNPVVKPGLGFLKGASVEASKWMLEEQTFMNSKEGILDDLKNTARGSRVTNNFINQIVVFLRFTPVILGDTYFPFFPKKILQYYFNLSKSEFEGIREVYKSPASIFTTAQAENYAFPILFKELYNDMLSANLEGNLDTVMLRPILCPDQETFDKRVLSFTNAPKKVGNVGEMLENLNKKVQENAERESKIPRQKVNKALAESVVKNRTIRMMEFKKESEDRKKFMKDNAYENAPVNNFTSVGFHDIYPDAKAMVEVSNIKVKEAAFKKYVLENTGNQRIVMNMLVQDVSIIKNFLDGEIVSSTVSGDTSRAFYEYDKLLKKYEEFKDNKQINKLILLERAENSFKVNFSRDRLADKIMRKCVKGNTVRSRQAMCVRLFDAVAKNEIVLQPNTNLWWVYSTKVEKIRLITAKLTEINNALKKTTRVEQQKALKSIESFPIFSAFCADRHYATTGNSAGVADLCNDESFIVAIKTIIELSNQVWKGWKKIIYKDTRISRMTYFSQAFIILRNATGGANRVSTKSLAAIINENLERSINNNEMI